MPVSSASYVDEVTHSLMGAPWHHGVDNHIKTTQSTYLELVTFYLDYLL